jgi:hypothetical protein
VLKHVALVEAFLGSTEEILKFPMETSEMRVSDPGSATNTSVRVHQCTGVAWSASITASHVGNHLQPHMSFDFHFRSQPCHHQRNFIHKVAQHYHLSSWTASPKPGENRGCILARRTKNTRMPQVGHGRSSCSSPAAAAACRPCTAAAAP